MTAHRFLSALESLHHFCRSHALYAAGILSVAAVCSWFVRVAWTDSILFLILPYNLVLGWIPLPFAVVGAGLMRRRWGLLSLVCFAAWLVWVPNSAYLVTDLVHLRSRTGIPHVYDSAMCAAFAVAGVLVGLASTSIVVSAVQDGLSDLLSRVTSRSTTLARVSVDLALPAVFTVIGLGVWCGRYLRWNTWDLLTRPQQVVVSILEPALAGSTHLWGITLTVGAGLWVSWLALQSLNPPRASAARMPRTRRAPAASARSRAPHAGAVH